MTAMELTADHALAVAMTSAIRSGRVDDLRALLAEHPALATAAIRDDKGVRRSLLHVAADWPGHVPNAAATVAALIGAGADVDAVAEIPDRAEVRETPLHWAASSDDVVMIDALLDGGADIEARGAVFTGGTPMSDAVVFAQWNAARRLLERGARTTLWQSAALGLIDRVRDSFDHGAGPSKDEITNAFWHACRGGQRETAAYLLERGADRNWIGHDGKTPLDVAQEGRFTELVDWLRARGARSSSSSKTPPAS